MNKLRLRLFFLPLLLILGLMGCKKEEAKNNHKASFMVDCSIPYDMSYAYFKTGEKANFTSVSATGAKTVEIEIDAAEGKELQLFVLSKGSKSCFIKAAIAVDGIEKARHDKACPAGVTGVNYKFE